MAAHSSTLAWKIPWKEEPGGLQSKGSWLSDFPLTFHFHALEKEMATHSSVLAWRIPCTGEPGGLPSMGSHRVGHDWSDLAAAEHWAEFPVLNTRFSLVIYFIHSTVCTSITISQFILPLFLPLVTMFLLYIYVSILQVGSSIPFFMHSKSILPHTPV